MGPSASELRTIPLFHGFDEAELAGIATLFSKVEGRSQLFDVSEPAETFYVLTEGEVVLDRPGDDVFKIRPPALIGELGALTGLARSTRATRSEGSTVWALSATKLQAYFQNHQELGVRFLVNLLSNVADKVLRDQKRMADMRANLVRTQKELKRLRELVLDSDETPLSAPVHDTLDKLITTNRRVNYRVEPPPALAATVRLDDARSPVADLSRTHVSFQVQGVSPKPGTWMSGVLSLAGTEIPISGSIFRVQGDRVTLELDLLIEEYAAVLEGYLTRVQLLDILC